MKMMHGAARICSDRCAGVCGMLGGDLRCWWWGIPGGDCLLCSRGLSAAIPTVPINTSRFPAGMYVVVVNDGDKMVENSKIIIR